MDEAFCGEAEINAEEIMQQIRAEAEKKSITETQIFHLFGRIYFLKIILIHLHPK